MQPTIPTVQTSLRAQANQAAPTKARVSNDLRPAMKATGAELGTGVPFAALYMARTTKKHAVLHPGH